MLIVLLLVGGVMLLHRFGARTVGFDPSAMLALGFVILASYAFGQLVGRFGLPHLTGYILAGMALGPSAVHLLPEAARIPPFDEGLLSGGEDGVIAQLQPFRQLAVGLIALTAGGELRFALLKRGIRSIAGLIGGHLLVAGPLAFAFVLAVAGPIPAVRLPDLGPLDFAAALAMAAVVGAVVISTSPAATVAVVAESRSAGPVTSVVLASVVLMDVVIVVLFSVASTVAEQMLGRGEDTDLGLYLLQHIGGSIVGGALVGALAILYLRFVKAELLLFLVGTIFTASFLASALHLEPVLLFISAGFVVANFSTEGEELLHTVERLFLPVSVVFFTLAGADLHLDLLARLAPFAVTMVLLRGVGTWVGAHVGLRLAGAEPVVRRLGWVGFIPQAGVALALASVIGSPKGFGELGAPFQTLLVAGIALNELVGPVLLKLGLSRAGELGRADVETSPVEPAERAEPEEPARTSVSDVTPWPAPDKGADAWGAPLETHSAAVDGAVRELSFDLAQLARDIVEEPLARFREDALAYARDLRREFLRHHRRITVQALGQGTELSAAEALRLEQAELAEKWRAAVLARAAKVRQQPTWTAGPILDAVDALVDALPEEVEAVYEPESFEPKASDPVPVQASRLWLRMRRGARKLLGDTLPPRHLPLRALARWHFWGHLPERLEPVAALHAQAESHLVARTRSIFDGLVTAYDALASEVEASHHAGDDARVARTPGDAEPEPMRGMPRERLQQRLQEVRAQIEEELLLGVQEIDRIADDIALRTSLALGACLRGLKEDAPRAGTPDLPMGRRAPSALYKRRDETLRWLDRGTAAARETSAALYGRLALEMELMALEGRVKDALEEHATSLGRDVRGRAHRQVRRVHETLVAADARLTEQLARELRAADLAREIRETCEPVIRMSAEAARMASLLRDQLTDERSVTGVLDALTRAAHGLTDRYRIPAGPVARGELRLPPQVSTVEVPFREWVLARIETSLAPRLVASTRDVAAKVEPLAQALSELERRVAFNVELATSELSVIEDESTPQATKKLLREMIGGALERNRELFAGYAAASERWGEEVRTAVRDTVLDGLEQLRGGIVDGEVGRLRFQMVRDVRGRRVVRFLKDLQKAVSRSWVLGRRALLEGIGEARIDRVRARLGLPVRLAEEAPGERTFAPRQPAASIPMVYRRLFSAQALEAGDILTGRDQALARAMAVLDGRTAGQLRTVAIIGPDGVGKSAFVNAVVRARRWPKVRELKLDAPASVEQIQAFFDQPSEGHLVVVSGLHWMRSIRPGGFEPLRTFVARVVADGGKNAFLLRSDALVWAQSAQAAPLADAFPESLRLDPLDAESLAAAVLARHTVSGYGLVFNQGVAPESRLEELVLQATAPLSRPQETFFRALHAASGGLLRDALRLWLASVQEVDEAGDFVHLGPVPTPSIYALRHLGEQDVLTLYQVARQGWMDAGVLASLFRTDETTAEARLSALAHVGILERRRGVWRIAVHLRGSVYRLLRERGYVA
jgi:Kef-type K+ transport system membrane component KefB